MVISITGVIYICCTRQFKDAIDLDSAGGGPDLIRRNGNGHAHIDIYRSRRYSSVVCRRKRRGIWQAEHDSCPRQRNSPRKIRAVKYLDHWIGGIAVRYCSRAGNLDECRAANRILPIGRVAVCKLQRIIERPIFQNHWNRVCVCIITWSRNPPVNT